MNGNNHRSNNRGMNIAPSRWITTQKKKLGTKATKQRGHEAKYSINASDYTETARERSQKLHHNVDDVFSIHQLVKNM